MSRESRAASLPFGWSPNFSRYHTIRNDGERSAELAFCFATGNTARMRALDCGLIEVGRSADFVIMDRAQHSPGKTILNSVQLGDLPGIGMTIIDGIVRTQRSRNTPPATKVPVIVGH